MDTIWRLEEPTVQQVIDNMQEAINYKTAMTVLNRLVEKGVLSRRKEGRAFVYAAIASREELLAGVFDKVVRGMFDGEFGQIALAQIIETVDSLDSNLLDDLSRLIEQRKNND